jgi:hypothetical protein
MKKSIQKKKKMKVRASKENRAPMSKNGLNVSSSMPSSGSLSQSKTITKEQKKGKPINVHQRRNTLAGPAEFSGLELNKNFYPDNSSPRKSRTSKPFLRKGSRIGPGAGAAITKKRSSIGKEQRETYNIFNSAHLTSSQRSLSESLVLGSTFNESASADSCSNEELKEVQNVVSERKKWGIPAKPPMFSGDSQKDATKGLKKLLLNIEGKMKIKDSSVIRA